MHQGHWAETAFSAALLTGTGDLVYRLQSRIKHQEGDILISNGRQVGLLNHRKSSQRTYLEELLCQGANSFPMGTEWQPCLSHLHPLLTQQSQKQNTALPIVLFIKAVCSIDFSRRLTELKVFWEQGGDTNPPTTYRHFFPLIHPWVGLLAARVLGAGGSRYTAIILHKCDFWQS